MPASAVGNDATAASEQPFRRTVDTQASAHVPMSASPAYGQLQQQDIQHTSSNQPLLASHTVEDESHSQDGAVSLDGEHAERFQQDQAVSSSAYQLPEARSTRDSHAPVQGPFRRVTGQIQAHEPQHVQRATADNVHATQHVQYVQQATAQHVHAPQSVQRATAQNMQSARPTDTIPAVKGAAPAAGASTDVHAVTGYQQPWSPPVSHQAQLPRTETEDFPALTARDARGKPQDSMGNAIKRILPDDDHEPLTLYYRRRGFNDFWFLQQLSEVSSANKQPVYYVSVKPLLAGWNMTLRRGASPADPAILHITKPSRVFKDKETEVIIKKADAPQPETVLRRKYQLKNKYTFQHDGRLYTLQGKVLIYGQGKRMEEVLVATLSAVLEWRKHNNKMLNILSYIPVF
ncbi:hypothetical protein WJX74_002582 [Apatococcus lobatus]|uniref:Uncharacterized protein n=1 Tax=Apatococcus lobatus TaxID=904363 RepID=A0AAW1RLI6_9CHLO